MYSFIKKYKRMLVFIVLPLLILGCKSPSESGEAVKKAEEININAGAVLKAEGGDYKLYDFKNNNYVKSSYKNPVIAYDKSNGSYIYIEDGKHYVVNNEKVHEIKDETYTALKLSPGSDYISYFIEDNGLKLRVFKTDDNNEVDIKSHVSISGTLYDWYDKDTIVYYGVSDDDINGLFTYNITENKEDLLYKIDKGYLAYIKGNMNDILFLQITMENDRRLMAIDKKSKEAVVLTENIYEIHDIVEVNNKFYFTGKMNGDNNSLYEINKNKIKRLVFDFPTVVLIKKGMMVDDDNNILFVGSETGESKNECIYSYSSDGTITVLSDKSSDFQFIDYRK